MFNPPRLTNAGKALFNLTLAGEGIKFTKIKLGKGAITEPIATMTDLVDTVTEIDAAVSRASDNSYVNVSGSFNNAGMAGFYWREIGLFAADPEAPENRERDVLYCYQNAYDTADYIPAASVETVEKHIFKGILTAAITAVGLYFRELVGPAAVLLGVMVMDYITGMADAWSAGELSSKVGLRGIVKKLCYLIAVAVAVVVDWIIQTAAGKAGMELGSFYAFGLLVTIWLILNECISILENLDKLGVPLPGFLRKIIEKLRTETEKEGGNDD